MESPNPPPRLNGQSPDATTPLVPSITITFGPNNRPLILTSGVGPDEIGAASRRLQILAEILIHAETVQTLNASQPRVQGVRGIVR